MTAAEVRGHRLEVSGQRLAGRGQQERSDVGAQATVTGQRVHVKSVGEC